MTLPLLTVHKLHKSFPLQGRYFTSSKERCLAVQGVSLTLHEGETLGIVGESGCGKTTLARMIAHIEKPTFGEVKYKGENIFQFNKKQLKEYRSKAQFIFQDPYASLNPRMTAGDIITEPFFIHRGSIVQDIDIKRESIMNMVGLSRDQQWRYPHEFSGGQRQRIGIARAIALRPEIIIADEPVSALDVSVQAQILNLLKDLQDKFNLAYLFISHDMGVIRFMSDRIAVMYKGHIVEMANNQQLFENPLHPYTRMLLKAIPSLESEVQGSRESIAINTASYANTDEGCDFYPRCSSSDDICRTLKPSFKNAAQDHIFACHHISTFDEQKT